MQKSFGDRSVSVAAPTLWDAGVILTFKSCLKTYLFKLAFFSLSAEITLLLLNLVYAHI